MPLDLTHDITRLRGAEYNPREIGDDDLAALRESVCSLGIVKPIIAHGETIVAGHQRCTALRSLGIETAPVYSIDAELSVYDEVLFNQLHNGTDLDGPATGARIEGELSLGWNAVDAGRIVGDPLTPGAPLRAQISRLVLKFGSWGGVVATISGEIIHCHHYALACAAVGEAVTAFVIDDDQREHYASRLSRNYGVYSYKNVEKRPELQSLAQIPRLRNTGSGGKGAEKKSTLYETIVRPWISRHPGATILDFGCGHGDYVKALRSEGVNIRGFDPFHRKGRALNVSAINRMVDGIIDAGGAFDAVVCNAVVNSAHCAEARDAIFTTVAALTKRGGVVFLSGRSRRYQEKIERATRSIEKGQCVQRLRFFDADGFSGQYRRGAWFFQCFQDRPEVERFAAAAGMELVAGEFPLRDDWRATLVVRERPPWEQIEAALRYEFDLPIGKGRTLGRTDVVEAVKAAQSLEK